jgi:polysaccharide biosynthesis/export protein
MTVLLALLVAAAMAPPAQTRAATSAKQDAAASQYVIGPQDLLKITIFDEPDLTNTYRVDPEGFITFPLISRISAANLTIGEFQDRLRAMLANGYIRNPQVRVDVDQFKSQQVYVIGEVRNPGKIPMTGALNLLEALALAGSPTAAASNEIVIAHPKRPAAAGAPPDDKSRAMPDEKDADIVRVSFKDLQLGKAGQDITLRDGDIINVPKALSFYITGQVRNPGSLIWETGMTLQQALALAGGLTDRGSTRGVTASRLVSGKLTDVPLKLTDKVLANDTITVRQRFF